MHPSNSKSNLLFYYYLVCAFLLKHLTTWRYIRGAIVSISFSFSLLICTKLIFNTNEKWNGVGGFFGSSHSWGLWNVLRSRLPVPDPRTVQVTTDDITGLYQLKWTEVVKSESSNFSAIWTEPFSRPKKVIKEATQAKNNLRYMGIQKEKKQDRVLSAKAKK